MIDVMNRCYADQFPKSTRFVSVIPTNIFGPEDNFSLADSHVLPGMMHRCYLTMEAGEKEFSVWGTGSALRQFVFSEDLGRLFLWVLDHYDEAEPLILSVPEEDEVSIGTVAQTLIECLGFQGHLVFDCAKADGQHKKTADNSKLMRLHPDFKFTPFKEALQKTCDWFKANFETCRK